MPHANAYLASHAIPERASRATTNDDDDGYAIMMRRDDAKRCSAEFRVLIASPPQKRASPHTYPHMVAVDVQLRYQYVVRLHALAHLLLVVDAHEDVALLELDEQRAQDLLDVGALGVRLPHDAHAGGVQDDLAGVLLLVVLAAEEYKMCVI